ncbi:phage tail protein [Acinetobacter guillouiae]|uniref:TipJ family phage tail tip protein n=1 Tax=Acinetobacter guillouiae TaxID=106649 RepID=UPI003AF862DD
MLKTVKGAKGGSKNQRQPKVANDTTASKTYARLQYGMSEGEVEGLANGFKSIFLDDTPVENDSGARNFQDVTLDFRSGTNDQAYMEGFESIASETTVGVELKSDTPWVKGITNLNLDAVIVRVRFGALKQQDPSNGDVSGIVIDYLIEVQTDGGSWELMLDTQMSGKTSANYERTHRIGLPKANNNWLIRVTRKTPNSSSEYVSDKMYIQAITEVVDLKLAYPNTALIGVQYDAETFSNIAKIAVDLKGVKIKVPSNYDPVGRTYAGIWDGLFKRAYSNNPAWIYYDLCTNKRYALGNRLTEPMIDKWSLYRLAQYCDQLVPNGKGEQEPRFTCNVYIQSAESAFDILSKLAGLFRAISYWDGNSIVCEADLPQDTIFTYTSANIIDGVLGINYTGTRARDRHNVVKVAWDNPQNRYKTEYVFVRDEKSIAEAKAVRLLELEAWGCTSEGQAQRTGQWALKTEQLETRTVTFKVGLDGYIPLPGKVIELADELLAGRANGGRISSVSADLKQITLDRDDVVCRAGDRLVVNGENGKAQARVVSSIAGRIVTVVSAFDSVAPQNVWVIDAQDLATMKFRVVSISQDEPHQFTITALQHADSKFDAIDHGAFINDRPISIINPTTQSPVESVTISSEQMVQQGMSVETMVISWPQAKDATKYQVEWRKDNGTWLKLPLTGNNSAEVAGIYAGQYEARVFAISAFDISSLPTYSVLTELKGKQGKPPKLANIHAEGILFGMKLTWLFPAVGALDTAYTEIEVSPDGSSNIAQLGLFAYPTTVHTIQGMQPNLRQYYRGRLIDRIGNVGDWSDWVSGETSADASDVLDLLHEQITESQLHKDLQTKIDHIDAIDVDISALETSVQQAKDSAQKANDDLATERTERTKAIQDVNKAVSTEITDRKTAIQEVTTIAQKANTDLATERSERLLAVSKLNDGLTAEIQSRKDGDSANTLALNNYKSSNDTALANVQTKAETAVSKSNANATAITALDSRVDVAESDASAAKTNAASALTKANTAVTDSSAAASMAQQANATATSAKSTADNALTNSATALSKADVAVTNASSAVSKVDAVEAKLGDYATTGALSTVDSKVADVDNKLTATTTKVDGVYAQINPALIGSESDLIGNEDGFAGVWSEQSARIEGDVALSKRIDTTVAQIDDVQALAQQEVQARVDGDKANTIALNNYISSNNSALSSVQQKAETAVTQSTANSSLITALDSRVDVAESDASTAKTNAASALSKANTAVTDSSAAASMAQQANATATSAKNTADNALTNSATALSKADVAVTNASSAVSKVDAVEAKLGNYATTGALSTVESKVVDVDNKLTAATTKVDGVYAQVNPPLIGSTSDLIGNSGGYDGLWSEQSARIEGDLAQSIRIDQVTAQMNDNQASVTTQIKTLSDTQSAQSSRIDTVQASSVSAITKADNAQTTANDALSKANTANTNLATVQTKVEAVTTAQTATAKQVGTIQTTVEGNTASIQTQQTSISGLQAKATIQVAAGNTVGGVAIGNDGGVVDFIVRANKFAIAPPEGTTGSSKYAFVYQSTAVTLPNGTVVPAGLYLDNASVGYISASKIHAESLSAVSATIGVLRTATSGSRMEIRDNVIKCYEGNTLRVQLGNLDL